MRQGLLAPRSGEGYDGPPLPNEPSMLERAYLAGRETDQPYDEWFVETFAEGAEAIPEQTRRELAEQFMKGRSERSRQSGGGGW